MPADERASLEADMLSAPAPVRAAFAVQGSDERVVTWASDFIILRAEKPA